MTYEELHDTLKAIWAVDGIEDLLPQSAAARVFDAVHGVFGFLTIMASSRSATAFL
ncbi:hypothetical protein [Rhizobium ruizarguesonis]|uniref:hypothetical protein n=1 Tax=Rhizobium ruizarguesonis TaxID=2081791 RepID=UPI0013D103C8|nr:hypothetical protein [Rhizobium ruizarguesonis]MBY5896716.1 hypothetical protein [Rhizobium leguminosarum]NEH78131.1 hypothetical protein [Rhizobium ruizarguesonis]